jgi:hypothetical protein
MNLVLNKFKKLGFTEYDGSLPCTIDHSLLIARSARLNRACPTGPVPVSYATLADARG